MHPFNFGDSPKSEESRSRFVDFQAQHMTFHLALEAKILKLEGSPFGNTASDPLQTLLTQSKLTTIPLGQKNN